MHFSIEEIDFELNVSEFISISIVSIKILTESLLAISPSDMPPTPSARAAIKNSFLLCPVKDSILALSSLLFLMSPVSVSIEY